MSEYIVDFGETSSAFVRLAMAEVRAHGAELCEPIVRCKDCVWAKPDQSDHEFRELRCNMWIADVSADGFCSRGKRKQ